MRVASASHYRSPLGGITLACEGGQLVGLWFEGQAHYAAGLALRPGGDAAPYPLRETRAWLDAYFAGRKPSPTHLPLAPAGTDFRRAVWRLLLQIPYGEVVTYGELAARLGISSARAIGGAVGHNPISLIIPCHRVLGARRALTGYAAGLHRKLWLLKHENPSNGHFYK